MATQSVLVLRPKTAVSRPRPSEQACRGTTPSSSEAPKCSMHSCMGAQHYWLLPCREGLSAYNLQSACFHKWEPQSKESFLFYPQPPFPALETPVSSENVFTACKNRNTPSFFQLFQLHTALLSTAFSTLNTQCAGEVLPHSLAWFQWENKLTSLCIHTFCSQHSS